MQASLAIVGCLTGIAGWLLGGALAWLVGALLIGAVIPFTFIVIMPTNHQLLAEQPSVVDQLYMPGLSHD